MEVFHAGRFVVGVSLLLVALGTPAHGSEPIELYRVAAEHYAASRWDQARDTFRAFVKEHPQHEQAVAARYYLGESLVQLREYADAANQFETLLAERPEEPWSRKALFRAAEANFFSGANEAALGQLRRFVNQYPSDPLNAYVLSYLGDLALEQADAFTAEAYYTECLDRYPQGPLAADCLLGRARSWERQRKFAQARQEYSRLAGLRSSVADDAQWRLATGYFEEQDYEAAAKAYAIFSARFADSPWLDHARLGQAQSLYYLERHDEAERLLDSLTRHPKLAGEAHYWLGLARIEQRQWNAAGEAFVKALDLETQQADPAAIAYRAGEAFLQGGKLAQAGTQFDRLLREWPTSEWADDCLAGKLRIAVAAGDHSEVVGLVDDLRQRFPQSPLLAAAQLQRARSLLALKKYTLAVDTLEPLVAAKLAVQLGELSQPSDDSLQLLQDRLTAHYLLALAYQGLDRHEDTLRVLVPLLDSTDATMQSIRSEGLRVKAASIVAQGKFADAISPLTTYLVQPSDEGESAARAQLAICYAKTGNFELAKKAYAEFQAKQPSNELNQLTRETLGEAALAAGEAKWAAELFDNPMPNPLNPTAETKGLTGKAWALYESGQLEAAVAAFEQLLKQSPTGTQGAEIALMRAQILDKLQRGEEALNAYRQVVTAYPQTPQVAAALFGSARLAEQQKLPAQAAADYDRLIKEFPQFPQRDAALYNAAWCWRQLNKLEQSTKGFEQLRREFPNSRYWGDSVYRLAESASEAGDRPRAIQLLNELLALQPQGELVAHALYLRAQLAIAEQAWTDAVAPLEQLVRDYPQHALRNMAEFWLAEVAYRQQKYEEVEQRLTRLSERVAGGREKWQAMIPLRRAQVCVHQKRFPEAKQFASSIEQAFPSFEQQYEVDYILGRCHAAAAELEAAREAYSRVIRSPVGSKTETAAMAQWMLAETYFHQRNHEAALREYLKVEILHGFPTWQALALLQAGKCHEALGAWSQATEVYARLLKNYPSSSAAEEATRRLQVARQQIERK